MHFTPIDFQFSHEVQEAIQNGSPVVALESTIISHGMPFPDNLQVAREVEEMVRTNGAVPATIAIMNGHVHVGLESHELENFAQMSLVVKCSRRDLPMVLANRLNGATTVASTMFFAHQAGIRFFATGGIGGVHRGAEYNFDISADLHEFTLSNVAVFSAGAKAILDLPKTLEYLETFGVPVIGFQTHEFPAFYTRQSGLQIPWMAKDELELARVLQKGWHSGTMKGCLVANPIPENDALDATLIQGCIADAINLAAETQVSGKELTPFLLRELNKVTRGKSQVANRALVLNNAAVAARTAKRYADL
jgi:pseudouridylate synthase